MSVQTGKEGFYAALEQMKEMPPAFTPFAARAFAHELEGEEYTSAERLYFNIEMLLIIARREGYAELADAVESARAGFTITKETTP